MCVSVRIVIYYAVCCDDRKYITLCRKESAYTFTEIPTLHSIVKQKQDKNN